MAIKNRLLTNFSNRLLLLFSIAFAGGCTFDPSPVQSPQDELDSFEYPSNLTVELVAAEPMIQDPVVISFDEDGRLWVVEMRGFMPDIRGNGERDKSGRISILEDTNGDGLMDSSIVYIDSLIMPRALAIVKGGALIAEDEKLWFAQDINGDLRADTKILIDSTYAGSPLPEHSGNGLWRGIDNWYYNVKSQLRYRIESGKWIRDSTEFRGQWGLSHDDEGRLIYNYNWSQLHADLVPPNYLSANKHHATSVGVDYGLTTDRRIYPIRSNPAVNRGYVPGTLDKKGRLIEFTAACSPFYYRGNALPKEYYGNVFVCEPSGNLIKRNVVTENGYYLAAYDPNPGEEFFASTDERFRPVYISSGPDGALYVVDMYRGLIQHGKYMTDYLRDQTVSRKLDKPVNCGRIWRIVPKKWKPESASRLSKANASELIARLSSANGWTRDMSQRILIERNDTSSISTLKASVYESPNPLGRLHALWALQGLHQLEGGDEPLYALNDTSLLVRTAAIRLLDLLSGKDPVVRLKLQIALSEKYKTASNKEVLQMALSSRVLNVEPAAELISQIIFKYDSSALMRDVVLSSLGNNEWSFLKKLLNDPSWNQQSSGKEILIEMLASAVLRKRDSYECLSLINKLEVITNHWQRSSMLTALSTYSTKNEPPIKLKFEPEILATNSPIDAEFADLLRYTFQWPGNKPDRSQPKESILDQAALKQFTEGRQQYLATCSGCHGTDGLGVHRFAPTLVGSAWVLGDERRLSLIVLQGMEGPLDVNGKRYDKPEILPVMPSHSPLDDEIITNILTYIRNAWGNHAGAVKRRTVGVTRNRSQGRVQPWTVSELENYLKSIEGQE